MIYEPLGKFVTLSQGLAVNKGTAHLFSDLKTDEFIYPLLRIVDLEKGNHTDFSKYVTKDIQKSVVITEDTIVFSRVTCQCFRGFSGVVHNNLFVVKLISDFIDKDYLFTILQSNFVKKQALKLAQSSVVPDLTHDMFKSIIIPVPDKETQQNIANAYLLLSSKIDLNIKICNELESMAKTLYDYWFTQLDFPNEEGKPYRSSGGEMVWNDQLKLEIPRGWNCSVIANHIGNSKSGDWGKESATGNYLKEVICIRGADFPSINENKTLSAPTRYILEKNANKVLSSGDIIVEISGGSPTQSTGRICYINENTIRRFDKDIITSNFCRAFSTKKKAEQYWLYLLWKTLYDAGVLFGFEGKTTGIKNLLFDDFCAQYKIVCPEEDILEKFHKIVSPIFEKMQQYNIENDELTKLRDWLLPMLMNGQATVE